MTAEQILKLLDAGYTKEEIQALEQGTGSQSAKPEPKAEEKPKDPPKDPEPAEPKIDYARLSMELMKAAAGKDTGYNPDHRTKEEQTEEALLSMVR